MIRDDDPDSATPAATPATTTTTTAYEPPALLWEEEWVPIALAVSCARVPGQSAGCNQAPGT